jgi:hypothetical protein
MIIIIIIILNLLYATQRLFSPSTHGQLVFIPPPELPLPPPFLPLSRGLYSKKCRNEILSLSIYLSCNPTSSLILSSLHHHRPWHALSLISCGQYGNKSSVGDVQIAAIRWDPVSAAGKLDASEDVLCLSIRPPGGRQSHPAAAVTVLCLSNGPFIQSHSSLAQKRCFRRLRPRNWPRHRHPLDKL